VVTIEGFPSRADVACSAVFLTSAIVLSFLAVRSGVNGRGVPWPELLNHQGTRTKFREVSLVAESISGSIEDNVDEIPADLDSFGDTIPAMAPFPVLAGGDPGISSGLIRWLEAEQRPPLKCKSPFVDRKD
jgi:hypothetical protein